MKKLLLAALLLCLFIACTKETIVQAPDQAEELPKMYDTIPIPIPIDSTKL